MGALSEAIVNALEEFLRVLFGPITGLIADNISAEWALAYSSVISLACVGIGVAYWRSGTRSGTRELTPTA